ncbi:MAG TPA: MauE/DoxX family redox-associated membrane protein [Thermomicrobiales bacterium]|nr:MauE/DoxX family redox-associated membrane protein [Thermomicrobiales bacterium]
MSLLVLLGQVLLAGVLIVAATGKLLRSYEFVAALRLSRLPDAVASVAAVAVPAAEAALAFWLVLSPPRLLPAAFAATAALLALFTGWMIWVRARRLFVRCGCFGGGGGEVGAATIVRNAILFWLAVGGAALATAARSPLPGFSFEALLAAVPLALAVALAQALWTVWPRLVIRYDQLRGGGELWEGE